jgi:hypothetical protein
VIFDKDSENYLCNYFFPDGEERMNMSIMRDNQRSIRYMRMAIWAIIAYLVILSAGVITLAISVNALWV